MDIGPASHGARCHCGMAVIVTSWTDANPGRRFQVCPKSKKVRNINVKVVGDLLDNKN